MIPGLFRNLFLSFALCTIGICVKAQIKADFTVSEKSGCAPLVVNFTDKSSGNPDNWKWDLGNGTISYLQDPSAIYFTPGKYTIKLIAKKANSEDSVVKTDFIDVYAAPTVDFTVDKTSGCYPLDAQFADLTTTSNGIVNSWLWDFGDGNSSTSKNPTHTYTSSNNFNVTLQVKNSNGCAAVFTKNAMIQIGSGAMADFAIDNPTTCNAPVNINFQNTSTGTGNLQYQWNFGDGIGSKLLDPSHTYTNTGSYTVSLITTNENGCKDTMVKKNAVTVGQVKARITISDTLCQNLPVQVIDASTPAPSAVTWYFGDGTTSNKFNPLKNYSNAGTYNLKLVANFGACTDSTVKTILVLPKPAASFSASKTTGCSVPFTTNFSAAGEGIVSYQWDFGDSAVSTLAAPIHVYNRNGSFTVKLIVVNSNGCTDTLVKTNYITIQKPTITVANLPDSSCAPFSKTFIANITSNDPVTQYLWDFGDGSTANTVSPTHIFTNEGAYTVSLTITTAQGCTNTSTTQRAIIVDKRPLINFIATPLNSCARDTINFTDSSGAGNSKWLWDFGDYTTSTLRNPSHLYIDTGYFDIQLTVWKGGCADSLKIKKYVHINAPVAKFSVLMNCTKPFERNFKDYSIAADEWHWDFGDSTTSTQQNPVHVYATAGTYIVRLTVVNHGTGCDYTTSQTITIVDPAIDFTASDTAVCKGTKVNFSTNLSLNYIRTFNWSFGDGSAPAFSSNGNNGISYVYNRIGDFDVRLITTDVNGCNDTLTKPAFIHVSGANAKFGLSIPGTCLNTSVSFSDSTVTDGIHPVTSWVWDYGDGVKDSLLAPPFAHSYKKAGAYAVSLTVYNASGCKDTYKLTAPLIIAKPTAIFNTADSFSCPGKQVHFANQSSGSSLRYLWNFGDKTTDTIANPNHGYLADTTYTVKLLVTDQYGCTDSLTRSNYISVKTPSALFSLSDSVTNCPPLIVKFTDLSKNAVAWRWDFGDSTYSTEKNPVHFYNFAGKYNITLTITSRGGCTSIFQNKVDIKGPQGFFTYPAAKGCNPISVKFTAVTNAENQVLWDFNDGNVISNSSLTASHSFNYAGSYLPKMILIDPYGCKVPIPGKDTLKVSGAKASFNFTNKIFCDSATIAYKDSSIGINDVITSYQWAFGDGHTSGLQNPNYQYSKTGLFYPKLIVKTSIGCSDSITSTLPVKIVASPKIDINYSGNGCVPLKATFSQKILQPDTSVTTLTWNFANGNASALASPPVQNYTTAGPYNVLLTSVNSSGCKTVVTKTIEAYPIPKVNAGPDTLLCKGSSMPLTATGADSYTWSPSTGLLCVNCASTVTNTINTISYSVIGTSIHGCAARDTIKVTVKERFVLSYSRPDSICKGESKQLSASGAYAYTWSPASSVDNPNISNPTVNPDTSTTYRVVAVDDKGCFRDTAFIPVKVNLIPTVEAGIDKTINVGQTVELVPEISNDVISVAWQPTSGIFRNVYPGITIKPIENTEYTVEVKNRGGCKAKDKLTVFVICNGSNIYIPNTFSPNSDGVNDVFYPRGTGLFKIKNMRIFNRWGTVVFDRSNFNANNPSDGWDGRNKGSVLNPDVFVYRLEIICDNSSILIYNGNISLLK